MLVKINLTTEQLKHVLTYDENTGNFTRRVRIGPFKKGSVAGTKLNTGYISIRVHGTYFQAHRLAWLYTHGVWPTGYIDHINHDKSDNRISNLRDVTWSENLHNLKSAKVSNQSRLLGVSPYKSRWIAQIQKDKVKIHIGVFDTPEEAHNAYVTKKQELNLMCLQQT